MSIAIWHFIFFNFFSLFLFFKLWTHIKLFFLFAAGRNETKCSLVSREKLMCKFPQDVNKTQVDFSVYFYSDDGGEEGLINLLLLLLIIFVVCY